MFDIIIKNGTIIDGTGKKACKADVGVINRKIISLGDLSKARADEVIDAKDKYVTPGFIDIHNLSDGYLTLFTIPTQDSLVRQGCTTIIGGNCGSSLAPLATPPTNRLLRKIWVSKRLPDIILAPTTTLAMIKSVRRWAEIFGFNINWLTFREYLCEIQKRGISLNFGSLVGHSTLRRGLIGDEVRDLTREEMKMMQDLITHALHDGSFGLSFGLVYSHANFVMTEELVDLAKQVSKRKGIISIHLRNEEKKLVEAVKEAITIGIDTKAKIQISHLKIKREENWGRFSEVLERIDGASRYCDIHFDIYPYTTTASVLYMYLPDWITRGGREKMLKRLKEEKLRRKIIKAIREQLIDYRKLTISQSPFNKTYVGRTISEIAEWKAIPVEEAVIDVLIAGRGHIIVFDPSLSEENLEEAIKNPLCMIATNGAGYNLEYYRSLKQFKGGQQLVHPRCFGTFPRFLGRYVREKKLINWEEAIRRITSLPAEKLSLRGRGLLKQGYLADITVFNPKTIIDRATYDNPYQYPKGVEWVLVNGEVVMRKGKHTGKLVGKILKK